jgi:hypothetical protein
VTGPRDARRLGQEDEMDIERKVFRGVGAMIAIGLWQ